MKFRSRRPFCCQWKFPRATRDEKRYKIPDEGQPAFELVVQCSVAVVRRVNGIENSRKFFFQKEITVSSH
jgi:hypothetical protein